ncbi:carbonic anhydrase [Streptomyces sp. NPDC059917]|uniref:carbonic anhydrase n=1 Tax=Streptomyces sp. NPDC059917 TaxID=3347002 RepID=UPI003662A6E0
MKHLVEHARTFPLRAAQLPEEWSRLSEGQSPHALFITCSDSRVVPSLITGARPGELFELRTAGNVVPHHGWPHPSGEAATIEYAVEVLGITEVIVCGHSHCGAVGALLRQEDLRAVPAVRAWLRQATPLPEGADRAAPDIAEAVQAHVLDQLARLQAYPCVARRLAAGSIRLYGWFYEIHTGSVLAHRPGSDAFFAL